MIQRHKDARTKGMGSRARGWDGAATEEGRSAKDTQSLQEEGYVFLELSRKADTADNLLLNIYPPGL